MRYWVWVLVRLMLGVGLVVWAMSYLSPGGGEKEFQNTVNALKKVDGVQYSMVSDPSPSTHVEETGEMVCSQHAIHVDNHTTSGNPGNIADLSQESIRIGADAFTRVEGGWRKDYSARDADSVCVRLANNADSWLFPDINEMLRRGIIQKGDKKTLDGVRCREWKVSIRYGADFERRTVCLGVDDHLPREFTVPGRGLRFEYTKFNQVSTIEPPDGPIVEPTRPRYPTYAEPIHNVPDAPNTQD